MRDESIHNVIEPLLIEYAAGVLNAADRRKVDAHLENCDSCRIALDEWRQIAAAARAESPSRDLPPLNWRLIKDDKTMIAAQPRVSMPRPAAPIRFAMPVMFATFIIGATFVFALMGGGGPSDNDNFAAAPPQLEQDATPTMAPTVPPTETPSPAPVTSVPQDATPTPLPATALPPPDAPVFIDGYNAAAIPEGYSPVVVANRNIENGAVITPADLSLYLLYTGTVPDGSQFDPDAIAYKIAAVNISCGQILTLDYGVVNARDVAANQPIVDPVGCMDIAINYRPGGGQTARNYDAQLYPLPVGDQTDVYVFASDFQPGELIHTEDLVLVENYPPALFPPAAITDPQAITGHILISPVLANQLVVASSATTAAMETEVQGVFLPNTPGAIPEAGTRVDITLWSLTAEQALDTVDTSDDERIIVPDVAVALVVNDAVMVAVDAEQLALLQPFIDAKIPVLLVPVE